MLKGVIFDLDGVIVDSHPTHKKAWRKFLSSVGKEVSDEVLEFVLDGRKKEEILRYFLGDLTDAQIEQYGHAKELIFREEMSSISLVEGCHGFIQELRQAGFSTAVASSGSKGRVHYTLNHVGLAGCFHAVVTGDEVCNGKPDPAIFVRAAERLRHAPSELLVIEDAVSGVRAAKLAGMKCLGVAQDHRQPDLLKAGADAVASNFVGLTVTDLERIVD